MLPEMTSSPWGASGDDCRGFCPARQLWTAGMDYLVVGRESSWNKGSILLPSLIYLHTGRLPDRKVSRQKPSRAYVLHWARQWRI